MVVEVYALSQSDAAKLLSENAGGLERYNGVRELVTKGKARLESLLGDVAKPGQRSVVEQIDEIRYAAEFQPVTGTEAQSVASAFETRNLGESLEWESALDPNGRVCDLNFVISGVRFDGFESLRAPQPKIPFVQPRFETRKITTSHVIPLGGIQFLGTSSAAPHFETPPETRKPDTEQNAPLQVKLVFGRVELVRIAKTPLPKEAQPATLEHQLSFYSLDREAARTVLGEIAKAGGVYAALQPLLAHHEAKLERLSVLKARSGQRGTTEEIEEVRYFDFPEKESASAKKSDKPVTHGAGPFPSRNTGLTLEVEPTLLPGIAVVDISLVPQLVSLIGTMETGGSVQPIFERRKVTTSLSTALGDQAFIGTFNPSGNTGVSGRKDTGRVWIGFIQVKLAQP